MRSLHALASRTLEHYIATRVQDQRGGGSYAAERWIAYKALRKTGVDKGLARWLIQQTDAYFASLGVTPSTPLPKPKTRR